MPHTESVMEQDSQHEGSASRVGLMTLERFAEIGGQDGQ